MKKLVPIVLAVSLLAACGGDADLDLGVRRVALSLAFADEGKATPVAPQQLVQFVPAPPEVLDGDFSAIRVPPRPPACPAAPENAPVADVAQVGITAPPAPGAYTRHNEGAVTLRGAIDIRLPFPRKTVWTIENIVQVEPPEFADDPTAPFAAPDNERGFPYMGDEPEKPMWEYTITKVLTPEYTIIDTYRLTSRRVLLLRREIVTAAGSAVFAPDPPITFFEHSQGEARSWRSGGIDTATGQAMYVDATIERREPVDVCGTLHDTYRIVMTERMLNLATGETSGTEDGDPNVYNVATQAGGLILREDLHFTQTVATEDGTPGVIEWDYQSTQDALEPEG